MSNPNQLGFSSSVGIYRNKRIRELRKILLENVKKTVQFADLAPMLFQVLMGYAAENQIDANFASYTAEDFAEIFTANHVTVSVAEAGIIQKAFATVGLTDNGKIRSWLKFNRHLGDYPKIVKAKRRAAHAAHKKREADARAKAAGSDTPTLPATPKPPSATARVISIKKLMENHPGAPNAANAPKDRDELEAKRAEYRVLKTELQRLNAEIASFPKAA